jgi:hypothetical protein
MLIQKCSGNSSIVVQRKAHWSNIVSKQHATEHHASEERCEDRIAYHGVVSRRNKPPHLLVQEFLVTLIHF